MFYVNDEPGGKILYTGTIKLYCTVLTYVPVDCCCPMCRSSTPFTCTDLWPLTICVDGTAVHYRLVVETMDLYTGIQVHGWDQ